MIQGTYNKQRYLTQSLFVVTLLFSSSAISQSSIGRVIHTNGDLIATSDNGTARKLQRGSRIKQGDVIKSGTTSKSQLRMIDGALIVLRQNTEMQFEQYHYNKRKSTGSSVFSLLRGGFRTLSGLIGKNNKKNYKVKTHLTTIGIRGTNYGVTLCEQSSCRDDANGILKDGLYASVIDGEISSENETGLYTFANDEYFYVASSNSEPQGLPKAPGVIFDPNTVATSAEEMDADNEYAAMLTDNSLNPGAVVHTNVDMQNEAIYNDTYSPVFTAADDISNNTYMVSSEPGDTMMFSYFQGEPGAFFPVSQTLVDDGTDGNHFTLNAIAADNGDFIPLASQISFNDNQSSRTLYIANAAAADVGSMNIAGTDLGWGRWSDSLYEISDDGVATPHAGSLHYVVADGGLTTPAQIGAMTGNFNYTTVAGTRATDLDGNVAASVADVNMAVDFNKQNIDRFSVASHVGGIDYQAELTGATPITTAINSGMSLTGNSTGTCPNCGGQATLGFVGTQAEGAITSYNIGNASTTTTITGTAVLKR